MFHLKFQFCTQNVIGVDFFTIVREKENNLLIIINFKMNPYCNVELIKRIKKIQALNSNLRTEF